MLTFDDGYLSQYRTAARTLRARGWPGVLNLQVDRLGVAGGLTRAQVRRMLADGWELDSHTLSHPDLTAVGPERLRRELVGSREAIQREFGVTTNFFCFPYGHFDAAAKAAVRAAGYLAATTTHRGAGVAGRRSVRAAAHQRLAAHRRPRRCCAGSAPRRALSRIALTDPRRCLPIADPTEVDGGREAGALRTDAPVAVVSAGARVPDPTAVTSSCVHFLAATALLVLALLGALARPGATAASAARGAQLGARAALLAAQSACFGAASRDPRGPCRDARLDELRLSPPRPRAGSSPTAPASRSSAART